MDLIHLPTSLARCLLIAGLFNIAVAKTTAEQSDNHGLHAIPVSSGKSPVMDGELSEWDLSGEIFCTYDTQTLANVYSAHVAAMYDSENFYIGIRWKDLTPMGNSHDPRYQAARGWAGDCVQLRFKTDRISHITAWYYAPRNEPAATISYGKDMKQAFGGGDKQLFATNKWEMQQGMEMAFKKSPDNKGYVQEIKIPWALFCSEKKYKAGERFSLGMEFLWGEGDWPAHRYADNLAEGATSREFFWESHNNWGAVYLEAHGGLALEKKAFDTTKPTRRPDGDGGPVEIKYTLQQNARVTLAIDDAQGRRIRNLIPALPRKAGANAEQWDGLDDSGNPAPPGDYTFKILTHDGIHANYALSFANPGRPSWPTPDGRGAFYADHSAPQAAAASPAAPIVALACPVGEAGNHLIACDLDGQRLWGINNRNAFDGGRISLATDGVTLWVGSEGRQSTIYRVELATGRYSPWKTVSRESSTDFAPLDLRVSAQPGIGDRTQNTPNLTAIAFSAKDRSLAAAFARENVIRHYNADTGALLSQTSIAAPQGLARTRDGSLIVISENRLWISRDAAPFVPLTAAAFPGACALATGHDGNIYMSVRGTDQNIKVFSPDGSLIREIGTRGGRPANGPFNPDALRNPAGLAIDARGQLWVTEETTNPKRTSVWNASEGNLIRDLSGTTYYASAGSLNPFDLSLGFSDNTVYRLDWKNNTHAPVYSLARRDDTTAPDLFPASVHNLTSRIIKHAGRIYIFTTGNASGASEIQCTLQDGHEWRSVAHTGVVPPKRDGKYQHDYFSGHENQFYCWTDGNGDALVQQNELVFTTLQIDGKRADTRSTYWGQLPGTDGAITYTLQKNPTQIVRFPITGINAVGAPLYDIKHPRVIPAERDIIGRGESYEGMLMGGGDGRVYVNQDPLVAIERDGRITGSYPNGNVSVHGSHKAVASRPGYLIGPSSILGTAQVGDMAKGEAGEIFALNGNLGENYLFTQDVLYIQALFRDTRGVSMTPPAAIRGMSMDNITAGGESFGGNFIRTPDGKTYLTLGGTDARVLEITGLESIRRMTGTFTYSKEQYAIAQTLRAQKAASKQNIKTFTLGRAPTTLRIEGAAHQITVSHDDENLRLSYSIKSPRNAPRNTGQDERLLFKTGDAADIMIAPADRPASAVRILMTQRNGRPFAMLNQKHAPGAAASERYEFSSPWRAIAFDRVANVTSQITLNIKPLKDGYAIEAAIPWAVLGFGRAPARGAKVRFDAGVLTGDASSQTTSRQYWSNKATNLVNDIPGEADLTPELWGIATLE